LPHTALKPAHTDPQPSPRWHRAAFRPALEPTPLARAVQAALAMFALGAGAAPVWAQTPATADAAAIQLKPGSSLQQQLPASVSKQLPVFVRGNELKGELDGTTVIEGGAELRQHDTVLRADRIEHNRNTGDAKATGNVLLNRQGDRFTGPEMQINLNTSKGQFTKPEFNLLNEGTGDASRVEFVDKNTSVVENGRYSTCPRVPGSDWMPDWLVRASSIEIDRVEDVGTARWGVVEFKGVPILTAPYLSFPLSDRRKSGALAPTVGLSSQDGVELTTPYYFNLAPNYDLTVTPTVMTKRGLDIGGEFRYLQPSYSGELKVGFMPSDKLRDRDRWAYSLAHSQTLVPSFAGGGALGMSVGLNRVGDSNYWRDFPRSITSLTSRLLASGAGLGWSHSGWNFSAGANRWQTLQDIDSVITPPYDQAGVGANTYRENMTWFGVPGWDLGFESSVTRFQRSELVSAGTVKSGGNRALVVADVSRRWQTPGWYVQPRARVNLAQYRTDSATGATVQATRTVPTLSVDSGLVFERDSSWFGRDYVQTLEPRAFVTWTPFRDQSALPNYDSGAPDFSLSSMYSENAFTGYDRVSDTKAVTLGVSSRLINPATGAEVVRVGVAQRALLADQKVTLPGGAPVTERLGDMLVSARVQWDPLWSIDTNVQYNAKSSQSARSTIGGRYTPGPYRAFSLAYRFQRDVSKQLDIGWQWPLAALFGSAPAYQQGKALGPGRWYSVGRLNYSLPDRKVIDLVAGFEYDAGCWIGRVVAERLQVNTSNANQRILFQLELNGFGRLGASTLRSIQSHVPKYRYLREEVVKPNRFQQYD
jgi:LPS-assembly protein